MDVALTQTAVFSGCVEKYTRASKKCDQSLWTSGKVMGNLNGADKQVELRQTTTLGVASNIISIVADMNIYHFLCHDSKEVSERDLPGAIFIHFTNHLLNLLFLWFKPQSSHRHLDQMIKPHHITEQGCNFLTHVARDPLYLKLFDIDESRTIGVKQLKRLPDLLFLLFGQLWFGGCLLARWGYWTLQGWSLGTGRLVGDTTEEPEEKSTS